MPRWQRSFIWLCGALLASCGSSDGRQATIATDYDPAEVAGSAAAQRQNLPFLPLPSILKVYDQKHKDEFETAAAFRSRIESLDDGYRAKNPFVTVIPAFPFRWKYHADDSTIVYNSKGIGSITAAVEIENRKRQAWIAQDDVDFGIGVNRLIVTQPCAPVFSSSAQLAKSLKAKDSIYFFAITLSVPAMSDAVQSHSYYEPANTPSAKWGVQELEAKILNVEVLSADGAVVASKSC